MTLSAGVYVTAFHLQPVQSVEPVGLFSSPPLGFMLHGEPNCCLALVIFSGSVCDGSLNTELKRGQLNVGNLSLELNSTSRLCSSGVLMREKSKTVHFKQKFCIAFGAVKMGCARNTLQQMTLPVFGTPGKAY